MFGDILGTLNDYDFYQHKVVQVVRSLTQTTSSFVIVTTASAEDNLSVAAGDEVAIYVSNGAEYLLVINGIVDRVKVSYDASGHEITIEGRSNTKDIEDSSVEEARTFPAGANPVDIVKALVAPIGINVISSGMDKVRPYDGVFEAKADGESIREAIHRISELCQFSVTDTPNGDLLLTQIDSESVVSSGNSLIKNVGSADTNILSGSFEDSEIDLYSSIVVKGQTKGRGKKAANDKATADAVTIDEFIKANGQ